MGAEKDVMIGIDIQRNMKDIWNKYIESKLIRRTMIALLAGFMILTFLSFIKAPFTGDVEVFIAAENQVRYKEATGLKAVFEAWELKGIGNRMLMFLLYSVASLFAQYGEAAAFELAVKTVYAVLVIAAIFITTFFLEQDIKQRVVLFCVEFAAVFCTYTASHLQAEMTCVVLSLLIFALFVHGTKRSAIAAGVIGALIFFFKSILVFLFFLSLCGAWVYRKKKEERILFWGIGSFAVVSALLLLFVRVYYPQEFTDMAQASHYQVTLLIRGSNVSFLTMTDNLLKGLIPSVIGIPFILVGICAWIVVGIKLIRARNWADLSTLAFMWLFVLFIIVVSNRYFIYHFYLMTLPGFVCTAMLIRESKINLFLVCLSGLFAFACVMVCWKLKKGSAQAAMINHSTACLVIVLLLFLTASAGLIQKSGRFNVVCAIFLLTVSSFFYMNYSSYLAPKFRNERMMLKRAEELNKAVCPEDFGDEPVLFLCNGTIPFFLDAPSYSRYFFNLPLQRYREKKSGDFTEQKEEYELAMQYEGKYIVYSDWIDMTMYPELEAKIQTEYEMIQDSCLNTLSPDWNFFRLKRVKSVEELRKEGSTYIMVRKQGQ